MRGRSLRARRLCGDQVAALGLADARVRRVRLGDTATKIREAECGKRGPNCRLRELDEQAAADKLATVTTNKAAVDQAAKLDADAAATPPA